MKSHDEFSLWVSSWEGTPYRSMYRVRGSGVDCVNFIAAYLDWLLGMKTPVLELPKLLGYHDPPKTRETIRTLESTWGGDRVDPGDTILPGDVLATKNGSNPVHLMLAGPQHAVLWHASNVKNIPGLKSGTCGVVQESLGTALSLGISRVWRFAQALDIRNGASRNVSR